MRKLLLALLALPAFAFAEPVAVPVRFTWEPPTENTDGSLLTDLAGFRLHWTAGAQSGIEDVNDPLATSTAITLSIEPGTTEIVTVYGTAYDLSGNVSAGSPSVNQSATPLEDYPPKTIFNLQIEISLTCTSPSGHDCSVQVN